MSFSKTVFNGPSSEPDGHLISVAPSRLSELEKVIQTRFIAFDYLYIRRRSGSPYELGGFDPDCDTRHIGEVAKQENKMLIRNGLFSSESVLEVHPDKWADQVSDAVPGLTLVQAWEAYERNDYSTAFVGFKNLADQGDADAQTYMGWMYLEGRGVPKDNLQAVAWYRKAAEQGSADAQYNLGLMYDKGEGVPKDKQSAYFWWLVASAQGDQDAAKLCDIFEIRLSPEQRATAKTQTLN